MEKPNILKFLPAILGFVALGLPAFGTEPDYPILMWVFGFYFAKDEFSMLRFDTEVAEKRPEMFLMPISGVVVAAGAVLALLWALDLFSKVKAAWTFGLIAGVLMIAGLPLYLIGTADTELLDAAPLLFNLASGVAGGVWAMVNAFTAKKNG